MYCPNCGRFISDNQKFCDYCGMSVEIIPKQSMLPDQKKEPEKKVLSSVLGSSTDVPHTDSPVLPDSEKEKKQIYPKWEETDTDIKRYLLLTGLCVLFFILGCILINGLRFDESVKESIAQDPGKAWNRLWKDAKDISDLKKGWPSVEKEWKERGLNVSWNKIQRTIKNISRVTDRYVLSSVTESNHNFLIVSTILFLLIPFGIIVVILIIKMIKNRAKISENEVVLIMFLLLVCIALTGILVTQGRLYSYMLNQ